MFHVERLREVSQYRDLDSAVFHVEPSDGIALLLGLSRSALCFKCRQFHTHPSLVCHTSIFESK